MTTPRITPQDRINLREASLEWHRAAKEAKTAYHRLKRAEQLTGRFTPACGSGSLTPKSKNPAPCFSTRNGVKAAGLALTASVMHPRIRTPLALSTCDLA